MAFFYRFVASLVVFLCLGSGCVRLQTVSPSKSSPISIHESAPLAAEAPTEKKLINRETIGDGMERAVYRYASPDYGTIEVYGFNLDLFEFGIVATSGRLAVGEWGGAVSGSVAVVNGSYFMEDGSPSGFLSANGVRFGSSAFDVEKSAVINFDDGVVHIVAPTSSRVDLSQYHTALQSYPVLIGGGLAAVSSDSGKKARRSFIGTDTGGMVWIGVVSDAEISLFDLARRLAEIGIAWRDVVNLDGGTSTGILIRTESLPIIHESFGGVPNVIVAMKRARSD